MKYLKFKKPLLHRRLFPLTCLMTIWPALQASSQEYFQQKVNYEIHVTLNDKLHELNAYETIGYINNSPDTLKFLYFHLWPNAYSGNNTDLAKQLFTWKGKAKLFNDLQLRGYIDSLDFKVADRRVLWNLLPGQPDICKIILTENLNPGDSIKISTPFHVKIPKGVTSRLGHIGESYQISQWYPKPAVYDRSGWHQMPYLDQGEFYSEFGSYNVSIKLPANYIVGATGDLENIGEIEMLDKLAADTSWKITLGYSNNYFPVSSHKMKTLNYSGNNIHDFAWFADKRFHVMKGKLKLPESGREITIWTMFTNEQAGLWNEALQYVKGAIELFSGWIGDYPYNTFTAVQSALTAGDGMEYPGITIVGHVDDAYNLDEVIAHEICHSWFYSSLGSDERRYPFMDESITSSYEMRYMKERYPGKKLWEVYFKNQKLAKLFHIDNIPVERMPELEWLIQARSNLEQPVNLPAPDYSVLNYTDIIYNKAALGFNYLRAYLSDSVFDSIMHDYYSSWKSKHPNPEDLENIFESHTDKNLSWFFNDFLNTVKRIDYKVVRLENHRLLVKNRGELASPLVISGIRADSIKFENWETGFLGSRWIDIPCGKYSEIIIDPDHVMPELFRLNNNIRTSGIFRKSDPLKLYLLNTVEDPDKRSLMWFPAVNWTKEDGFMLGINLYNKLQLPKSIEYNLTPFYKVKDTDIAGEGKVSYNITPYDNFIRMAAISIEGTQYGTPGIQNYIRAKLGLDLYFRNIKINNSLSQKVFGYYIVASDLFQLELHSELKSKYYSQFGYQLEKTGPINPFSLRASIESGNSYQKAAVEFNYKISYYGEKSGLDMRIFTGTMLNESYEVPFYDFSPSGRSGREQYLFDGNYFDRFSIFPKTFWSRQMTLSEGGLVSPVNDSLGYSHYMVSFSFTSNFPGNAARIPIKPFVNILLNDHGTGNGHNSPIFYEAGLKAGFWNVFEIYVPIIVSSNIGSIRGTVKDRIRFVLNLNSFNSLKFSSGL